MSRHPPISHPHEKFLVSKWVTNLCHFRRHSRSLPSRCPLTMKTLNFFEGKVSLALEIAAAHRRLVTLALFGLMVWNLLSMTEHAGRLRRSSPIFEDYLGLGTRQTNLSLSQLHLNRVSRLPGFRRLAFKFLDKRVMTTKCKFALRNEGNFKIIIEY